MTQTESKKVCSNPLIIINLISAEVFLQSSISQLEYDSGLEVDMRAREQKEKYLSTVEDLQSPLSPDSSQSEWNEKKAWAFAQRGAAHDRHHPSISGETYASSVTAGPTTAPVTISEFHTPSEPTRRPICGLRRRWFWTALSVFIIIVVLAAIVSGVIAGRRSNTSSSPPPALPSVSSSPISSPISSHSSTTTSVPTVTSNPILP
jgi:hypothetical protein